MRTLRFPLALLGLLALAACNRDDTCAGDAKAVCAWDPATQNYTRDCRMVCPDHACAGGAAARPVCGWDQTPFRTGNLPTCDMFYCPADADARIACDGGGIAATTYYSNDPRCLPPDGDAGARD